MERNGRLAGLVVAGLALGCTGPGTKEPVAGGPAPLRFERGLALVEVRVLARDASQRVWFLLDTGLGDALVIDPALADALDMRLEPAGDPLFPYFDLKGVLDVVELSDGFGRVNVPVFVHTVSTRPELDGLNVGGVLGTRFLRGQKLWLDFADGLYSTSGPPASRRLPATELPLQWGGAGTLRAQATLAGQSVGALLDSGSSRSFVKNSVAERLGLPVDRGVTPAPRPTPFGEMGAWPVGPVAFELGADVFADVEFLVPEQTPVEFEVTLGMDLLGRYSLVLDLGPQPALKLMREAAGVRPVPGDDR